MSKTFSVLVAAGLLLCTGSRAARADRGDLRVAFEGRTIDELIAEFMEEQRIPGMTLAIVQAPYVSRVTGYGLANVEKKLLAAPHTLWNVGQISCAYTAVAVMQLVEAGKLSIDDTLEKHLSVLPPAWRPITVKQLMARTSGLADYARLPTFQPARDYKPIELLALVRDLPAASQRGRQAGSGATDFYMLGLVVEKAAGMPYAEFVRRSQIAPLQLKHTGFVGALPQTPSEPAAPPHKQFLRDREFIDPTEAATGYAERDGKLVPVATNAHGAWFAHGAVWASAEDISLWDIGLAGELLVSRPENRKLLYAPALLADGSRVPAHCGWRFAGHPGLMEIAGSVPGFSCHLSRFTHPSELLCVTLCANKSDVDLTALARMIAGAFDRKLGPPVAPSVMACRESCYPGLATVERLAAELKAQGFELADKNVEFAPGVPKGARNVVPEAASRVSVSLRDRPVEAALVKELPALALDLPLRVAVWSEKDGSIWIGHPSATNLARRHGALDKADSLAALRGLVGRVETAVRRATTPY